MNRAGRGWWHIVEWAIAFALLTFAVITGFTIGVFVMPVAAAALALALFRNRAWPEAPAGLLVGSGAVLLMIGFLHRNDVPCRPEDQRMVLRRGETFSCGGFNPWPWFNTGAVLTAVGVGSYVTWQRRRDPSGMPRQKSGT